jgi:Chlorophyll A-B binding protein
MKFAAALITLFGSAAAFAPVPSANMQSTSLNAFVAEDLPGALAPVGFFDPLGFAAKADEPTLKRYREAELTHGRVAMLAVVGFLVGEKVEGSSFLFDAQVSGPAITHLTQVPTIFWSVLAIAIGAAEIKRAEKGWVEPENVPVSKPGLLRAEYYPGDLGFDPLGLKPSDAEEMKTLQTKELQNGRLAMLAAAGFMAQELVNGKGILENLFS